MEDHCTFWPDRFGQIDWSHCCFIHDVAYEVVNSRWESDIALVVCVAEVAGWPLGLLMGSGVVMFGWIFWKRNPKHKN